MQTNIERRCSHALVLAVENLTAIINTLTEHYEGISFLASCSDGSTLSSETLDEILTFENPSFRRIESLRINAVGASQSACIISFATRTNTNADFIITDHDDKRALKIADELDKRIHECRPYYSALSRVTPTFVLVALWGILAVFSTWYQTFKNGHLPTSSGWSIELINLLIPIVLAFFGVMFYIDRGWKWMFPKLWFSIGRQIRAFDQRATVRYWVFGIVILGIILCVIGNLITLLITKP